MSRASTFIIPGTWCQSSALRLCPATIPTYIARFRGTTSTESPEASTKSSKNAPPEPYVLCRAAPPNPELPEEVGHGHLNEVTIGLHAEGTLPAGFDYDA